jgi:type II secretory pathway pseudopilin PulG
MSIEHFTSFIGKLARQNAASKQCQIETAQCSMLNESPSERAFSLIELIGVLAIFAFLAAAAVPTFIRHIDHEAKLAEAKRLGSFTNALVQNIIKSNEMVTAPDFPIVIGSFAGISSTEAGSNARGFPRLYLTDPALSINGGSLPYVQTGNGAAGRPANARAVIISTIAKALPVITPDATEFAAIWNAPEDTIPTPLSSWGGRGEDLLIQRVDFGPLFHELMLVNVDPLPDAIPNRGYYSINDASATYVVPDHGQFVRYFLPGTITYFYRADGSTLDTRDIIDSDMSFVYRNHKWGRRLTGSDDSTGGFGALASEFLKPPAPPNAKFAATQQAVVNLCYGFLWNFGNWAYGDTNMVSDKNGVTNVAVAPYGGTNQASGEQFPFYSLAEEAQVKLDDFSRNLIGQ